MAEDHLLLLLDYVPDMVERRGPHREGHLARIRSERDAGRVVMAGALGDPPTGGAIAWRGVERSHVERFVEDDPYMKAGLITGWRIEPWKLV